MIKTTGIKPTFKGRMNLNKNTGDQDEGNFGVKTNYGFAVSYKSDQPSFVTGEGMDRKPRGEKGVPFGEHMAVKKAAEEDDDFQIVREKERKVRVFNKDSDDEEEQNDETKITRGFNRGGARGGAEGGARGGFFKNSAKREE